MPDTVWCLPDSYCDWSSPVSQALELTHTPATRHQQQTLLSSTGVSSCYHRKKRFGLIDMNRSSTHHATPACFLAYYNIVIFTYLNSRYTYRSSRQRQVKNHENVHLSQKNLPADINNLRTD